MVKREVKVQAIESYKIHMSPDAELALKQVMNGEISPSDYAERIANADAMSFERVNENREVTISYEDQFNG
jgi:hypothetical protein